MDSQSSSGLQVVPGNREVGAQCGLALPTVTCTQVEPGLGLHPTPTQGQAVRPHGPTWAHPGAVAGFRSRGVIPKSPWQGHQWPWLGFRAWLASAGPSASRRRQDRAHSQWPAGYRNRCAENSGQYHDLGAPSWRKGAPPVSIGAARTCRLVYVAPLCEQSRRAVGRRALAPSIQAVWAALG